MEIIENNVIKEKVYKEVLDNGLRVYIVPKETRKKYVVWSTNFGSIDNKFYNRKGKKIEVPDGIAHYCEHKMFEQPDGTNSLDTLTAMGVDANAYTTNDHTAYLFECTENFDEALDELMSYVQNPYFTDENIEKERGIISQEIMMYDDYPDWKLYMNLMKALYKYNEINIDTAGTVETIQDINKENLYEIYNAFYQPDNMIMVCVGNFSPEEMLEKIKVRMKMEKPNQDVKRIYNEDEKEIVKKYVEEDKELSVPLIAIGFKDLGYESNFAKRDIAIDIIADALFGPCSKFYEKMYEAGYITTDPLVQYEFSKNYKHVMIQAQTKYIDIFIDEVKSTISQFLEVGIAEEDFKRAIKCEYADILRSFNDVSSIGNMFVSQIFKDIEPFEYIDMLKEIDKGYVEEVLKEVFNEEYMSISVIK